MRFCLEHGDLTENNSISVFQTALNVLNKFMNPCNKAHPSLGSYCALHSYSKY